MAKTVHVIPATDGWIVKREGRKADGMYRTRREAIERARRIAQHASSGQFVVYGKDGQIREHRTFGLPRVQDPPGKKSTRIEKAVSRVVLQRLGAEPPLTRG